MTREIAGETSLSSRRACNKSSRCDKESAREITLCKFSRGRRGEKAGTGAIMKVAKNYAAPTKN